MAKITTNEFECEYKVTDHRASGDLGTATMISKIVAVPGTYNFSFVVAHSVASESLVGEALKEMMRSVLVVTGSDTTLTYKKVTFTRIQ